MADEEAQLGSVMMVPIENFCLCLGRGAVDVGGFVCVCRLDCRCCCFVVLNLDVPCID